MRLYRVFKFPPEQRSLALLPLLGSIRGDSAGAAGTRGFVAMAGCLAKKSRKNRAVLAAPAGDSGGFFDGGHRQLGVPASIMPKPTNLKFFLSGDKVNSLTLSTSIISDSENTWCPATSHYGGMLPPSVHCVLTWYAFPRQQRNIKLKALQISRFDSPSG